MGGRGKKIDLSNLRCLVVDEADVFFNDDKSFADLEKIVKNKDI